MRVGPLEVLPILVAIGVIYLIYRAFRPGSRACPRCGVRVKNGLTRCQGCRHDFAI